MTSVSKVRELVERRMKSARRRKQALEPHLSYTSMLELGRIYECSDILTAIARLERKVKR